MLICQTIHPLITAINFQLRYLTTVLTTYYQLVLKVKF